MNVPPVPVPEGFYELCDAWKEKKITLKQAANACGMPEGTFYGKAMKLKENK